MRGHEARRVVVDGELTSSDKSAETLADYRLVGVVLSAEAGAIFVEMTGPKELVETNEDAFDQFVESVDLERK